MDDVLLGADLGTSGLKLVALDEGGAVVAEAEAAHRVDTPRPGWAQTDVAVWRAAFDDALARLTPALGGRRVAALGLAGQMHGAVLVDEAGAALAPALLWPDQRASSELARWRALPHYVRAALANPLVPGMTGPLVAWLSAHQPELLARAAAVLLPKDAFRAGLLPGVDPAVTDRSDASATLLWDVPADTWSAASVAAAGLDPSRLPVVRPADSVAGTTRIGGHDVPVAVGAADTAAALLAAGAGQALQLNLGTGAQLLCALAQPVPVADPLVHTYADAGHGWYSMVALQNAGSAWTWVCEVLRLSWPQFVATLEASPPGAGGVSFRPFLTGERGGVAVPDDRAGWSGMQAGTTRADLARAAIEGVAFAIAAGAQLMSTAAGAQLMSTAAGAQLVPATDGEVLLTGGGGREPAVVALLADVLDRPVRPLRVRSASASGAAALAGQAIGRPVIPQRSLGPVVEPSPHPALVEARERWAGR